MKHGLRENKMQSTSRYLGALYVYVNDEKRRKLDPKSEACIFVGYCEHSKAYKFYNSKTHKVVVSRDAIFDEGGVWSDKKCPKLFTYDGNFMENEEIEENQVQPSHVQSKTSTVQPIKVVKKMKK